MSKFDELDRIAFYNAKNLINIDKRFPGNVFREKLYRYFFFDPYFLSRPEFIEFINKIMLLERSNRCCLVNLDAENHDIKSAILFKCGMGFIEFIDLLKDHKNAGVSWLYTLDRHTCATDKGEWGIYCERQNDIGVIAIHNSIDSGKFAEPLLILRAISVNRPHASHDGTFSFDGLTPEWRKSLMEEYKV